MYTCVCVKYHPTRSLTNPTPLFPPHPFLQTTLPLPSCHTTLSPFTTLPVPFHHPTPHFLPAYPFPPTHLRGSFILFRANNLLPFSSASMNMTNSSFLQADGTSEATAPAYAWSAARARSSVAGSRGPASGGRGRRGRVVSWSASSCNAACSR